MTIISKFIRNITYTCNGECPVKLKFLMLKDELVYCLSSYSVMDLIVFSSKVSCSAGLLYIYISLLNKLFNYIVYDVLHFTGNNVPMSEIVHYYEEDSENSGESEKYVFSESSKDSELDSYEPEHPECSSSELNEKKIN